MTRPQPLRLASTLALLLVTGAASAQDAARERPVMRQVEEIQREVEALRGLRFRAPVDVGVQTADALQAMLLEDFDREAPAEEVLKEERVAKALGLIPQDEDLRARYLALLGEHIAGFYLPDEKKLYLIDRPAAGLGAAAQDMNDQIAMAHELHHALQDQHFGLDRWYELLGDHADRMLGSKALVEGEAQLVGMTYVFEKMGRGAPDLAALNRMQDMLMKMTPEGAKLAAVPPYILENLMFPYTQGAEFVQDLQRKHGWEGVTRAFSDPPASTEQVLHPERYYERDEPTELLLATAGFERILGHGTEVLFENTLGEFNVGLLLRALGVNKAQAARAAAGWDGDRLVGLEDPSGNVVVVWLSTWDSEAEAEEFVASYGPALTRFSPRARLERRGTDVLLVDGAGEGALERLVLKGFMAARTESRLEPLPALVARPEGAQLQPEAEASEVSSASAAPAALVHLGNQRLSLVLPQGFEARAESIEALARLGGAHFVGLERGQHLRAFVIPIDPADAVGEVERMIKDGVQGLEGFEHAPLAARGLEGHEFTFTAQLPGDSIPTRSHLALLDRGSPGQALAVGVSDADPARARARFEEVLSTLWVDAPPAPGHVQPTRWGEAAAVIDAAFAPAAASEAPADVRLSRYEAGEAAIQVVSVPAPAGEDLTTYGKRLQAQLAVVAADLEVVASGVVRRGGQEALELELVQGGRRSRQVTYRADDRLWTLSCSAPQAEFEARWDAFSRALATFRVGAERPTPPVTPVPRPQPERPRRAY